MVGILIQIPSDRDAERTTNEFINRLGIPLTMRDMVLDVTAEPAHFVDPPNGTQARASGG